MEIKSDEIKKTGCRGKKLIKNMRFLEQRSIVLAKTFRHKSLEKRAVEYGGQLHLYEEFDWGETVGREV